MCTQVPPPNQRPQSTFLLIMLAWSWGTAGGPLAAGTDPPGRLLHLSPDQGPDLMEQVQSSASYPAEPAWYLEPGAQSPKSLWAGPHPAHPWGLQGRVLAASSRPGGLRCLWLLATWLQPLPALLHPRF